MSPGMAGHPVFSCPEPRRADGSVLRLLQHRHQGKATSTNGGKQRQCWKSAMRRVASRKSWARLIQKIYEVDPLICPLCRGPMRVISAIEDQPVIKKILNHLGLLTEAPRTRPPPRIHDPPIPASVLYAEGYQRHPSTDDMICDPIYPPSSGISVRVHNRGLFAIVSGYRGPAFRGAMLPIVFDQRCFIPTE